MSAKQDLDDAPKFVWTETDDKKLIGRVKKLRKFGGELCEGLYLDGRDVYRFFYTTEDCREYQFTIAGTVGDDGETTLLCGNRYDKFSAEGPRKCLGRVTEEDFSRDERNAAVKCAGPLCAMCTERFVVEGLRRRISALVGDWLTEENLEEVIDLLESFKKGDSPSSEI